MLEQELDRLNGRWVYGSRIHISLAQRGSKDRFWKKKKVVTPPLMKRLIADCEFPPQVSASTLHQVEGVIAGDNRECFQVMRVSGDRVLLIFDDVGVRTRILASDSLSKWFDRVAEWNEEDCAMGCWRETLEPSSFYRGRVLIETGVLDRIEERLQLVVEGLEVAVEGNATMVAWRENELWEDPKGASYSSVSGRAGATIEPSPMLLNEDSIVSWFSIPITDEVELQTGPVTEDSTT
ncbi:hypothetical protein V6N11_044857 [Hibiscus sabdariffa]|uniref:DUF3179 domain-containing protein n=1 Tax=Hibiscus sabdariffa TaxID=183260 RepID=A0ABR2PU88_9ROSI